MIEMAIKSKNRQIAVRGFADAELEDAHLANKLIGDEPTLEAFARSSIRLLIRTAKAEYPTAFNRSGGHSPILRRVIEALKGRPATIAEIRQRTRSEIGTTALRLALRRLEEMGVVVRQGSVKKAGTKGGRSEIRWQLK